MFLVQDDDGRFYTTVKGGPFWNMVVLLFQIRASLAANDNGEKHLWLTE